MKKEGGGASAQNLYFGQQLKERKVCLSLQLRNLMSPEI